MMSNPPLYPLFHEQIDRLADNADRGQAPPIIRLAAATDMAADILEWISSFRVPEKFYLRAKDGSLIMAGLGSAQVIETGDAGVVRNILNPIWKTDSTIPVFGGFSFHPAEDASAEWQPFSRFRFTLPFVEIRKTEAGTQVAVNYLNKRRQPVRRALMKMAETLQSLDSGRYIHPPAGRSLICRKQLVPEKAHWNRMVKNVLRSIKAGEMKKIVLARKKVFTHVEEWNPELVIAAMAKIAENSFTFFYQVDAGVAFLGRSPERLLRIENGCITAEAIAGTRPRGKTPADDQRLEAQLLSSQKELEEHRIVADYIENRMNRICTDVRMETREEILKLKSVQHIITRFVGRVQGNSSPLEIALAFHPTPAVGGYPPDEASLYITRNEPFRRGWYASPIGWMSGQDADFAVGIRSALVNRNELHIFAGAGIVGKSNAHDEWNETEKKMDNFTSILGAF